MFESNVHDYYDDIVNDRQMHQYVAETSDTYFERMALYTWHQFLKIATLVAENSTMVETVCADQLDHLYYVGDVFQSCIGGCIEKKLRGYMMSSAIIPFLDDDVCVFLLALLVCVMIAVIAVIVLPLPHETNKK